MSENKETVERYMDAYRRLDHAGILDCLTDDVEWLMPGAFHTYGKNGFDGQIESDCYTGKPSIVIARLTEEADVVVAEGSVKIPMSEGGIFDGRFCDVFEMREAKIRRLTSYVAELRVTEERSIA